MGSQDSAFFGNNSDFFFLSVVPFAGNTSLPYILAEAMVNHKKMVHPPCIL
jgi:hypothetical protein